MDPALWYSLIGFIMFIPSLAFHEFGHAWVAHLLGDDTAKNQGRMTLNPIVHIDPIGTIAIPLFSIFLLPGGIALFGWAKPVPVDPRNFRFRRRDDLLVTLAGPFANFLLALVAMPLMHFPTPGEKMEDFIYMFTYINVFLGVFNLITVVPPLDGYRVIAAIFNLPESVIYRGGFIWPIILLVLINFPPYRELLVFMSRMVYNVLALLTGLG